MKSLSSSEKKQKARLSMEMGAIETELETALEEFREEVQEMWANKIQTVIERMEDKNREITEFVDSVLERMNDYEADRSDNWRESDSGEAFVSWQNEWESFSINDIELELPDFPTMNETVSDLLYDLPESQE